ncbi:sensor histidine kinase [Ammoniphilus sp. YIM 78166]|uniref:ATP-binding protein n=1 Tax=Ammoniphilus sp. YIM 78166 TaxID=1644106 RepID=UPI0010703892|nr:sensor histidine kinase [Ammoniphilus sp. YIM 78166]
MNGLEPLLLNVLFLIVLLLFVPFLLENKFYASGTTHKKKWIMTLAGGLAILSCISFPITMIEGYIFDLRLVALVIVGLYGGAPTILFLGVLTITYRFLLGGLGAYATIIVVPATCILLLLLTKRHLASSRKKKILIGSSLSTFAAIFAVLNSVFLFGVPFNGQFLFMYVVITFVTTVFILYAFEWITETIMVNQRILKAEKLEIVSHLASSISHEVRNPLAVIKGFLQMMEQTDIPANKRKEFLKICLEEIDRATDIIRNYLTFAKPAPENFEVLNVQQELQRAISVITPLANMNSIEIETTIEPCFIKGEAQFFQQCVLNLTKNCIEAMPDSGKLSIHTRVEQGQLCIVVSDTGKGMTTEQLSRIGEPYFTTKGREGTGLGMMTAIRIIEMMNGKLTVTSEINEGTKFYIRLPLIDKGLMVKDKTPVA